MQINFCADFPVLSADGSGVPWGQVGWLQEALKRHRNAHRLKVVFMTVAWVLQRVML